MELSIQKIIYITINQIKDYQALWSAGLSILAMCFVERQNKKRWKLENIQKVKINQTIELIDETVFLLTFLTNILYKQKNDTFCEFTLDDVTKIQSIAKTRHNLLMLDKNEHIEKFYKNIDILNELFRYFCEKALWVKNGNYFLIIEDKKVKVDLYEFIKDININRTSVNENLKSKTDKTNTNYLEVLENIRISLIDILKYFQKKIEY